MIYLIGHYLDGHNLSNFDLSAHFNVRPIKVRPEYVRPFQSPGIFSPNFPEIFNQRGSVCCQIIRKRSRKVKQYELFKNLKMLL